MRPLLALLPLLVLVTGSRPALAAEQQIDFEEPLALPDDVGKQYCTGAGGIANRGVEFLGNVRVYAPQTSTSSPTRALTNERVAGEFEELEVVRIVFTTPQEFVRVKAGLDRGVPSLVTGTLRAYSGWPGQSTLLATRSVDLSLGPTPITTELGYTHSSRQIRGVEIEYRRSDGVAVIEVLDDLRFSHVGPPCINDGVAPSVTIRSPEALAKLHHPNTLLSFRVNDGTGGSGVASVEVVFRDAFGADISGFAVCGSAAAPPCVYTVPDSELEYAFFTRLPSGTARIVVFARDFSSNTGVGAVGVDLTLPAATTNLWLQALEITQAVQSWVPESALRRSSGNPARFDYPSPALISGGVPLVADRATAVRVYAGVEHSGGAKVQESSVVVRCFRDPAWLVPCAPAAVSDASGVVLDPAQSLADKRADATRSWNLALPDAWVREGRVWLEAEVRASPATPECTGCADAANRLRLGAVRFVPTPHFRNRIVRLLGIGTNVDGSFQYPTQAQIDQLLDFLRRTWPIDEKTVHGTVEGFWHQVETDKKCGSVLARMDSLDAGFRRFTHGIARINGYDCSGLGNMPGPVSFSIGGGVREISHEVGHNLGIKHSGPKPGHGGECKEEVFCEDWPWPHGTSPDYGFDVFDLRTVYAPGTMEGDPHDFMSYGARPWVSARTWTRVFNELTGSGHPLPGDFLPATAPGPPTRALWVRGFVDGDEWRFRPVYEVDLPPGVGFDPGAGAWSVALLDVDGAALAAHAFDLPVTPDLAEGVGVQQFEAWLPATPEADRLELRDPAGDVAAELVRTPEAPEIEILSPDAAGFAGEPGEESIEWDASDPEGDPLWFRVEYAPRLEETGGDWRVLGTDLEETQLPALAASLPGGDAARIRVTASDGFRSTSALSAPFAVPDRVPQVKILSPAGLGVGVEGFPITMRGSARDPEDGDIVDPAAYTWTSLVDGVLGQGPRIDASLSPGVHAVFLEALDPLGNPGADVTVVVVLPLEQQPRADAGPERRAALGGSARLDGRGSSDPDGDPLSWQWSIVSTPPGGAAGLDDPASPTPQLLDPTLPGDYRVGLVVDDGHTTSQPAFVTVHVGPPPNDSAANASTVADGSRSGSLTAATNDGSASQGQPDQPDVWFVYTPPRDGTLYVDTCGSHDLAGVDAGLDTVLSLHASAAGRELVANDDWTGSSSHPEACLGIDEGSARDSALAAEIPDAPVWIRIARYGPGTAGDFVLRLRFLHPDDADLDGIVDRSDNCAWVGNQDQADVDRDGIGDACTCGDVSNDGRRDLLDAIVHARFLANLAPGLQAPERCSVTATSPGCDPANLEALRAALHGGGVAQQSCAAAGP